MATFQIWFYVIGAVAIAVAGNSVATVWARPENRLSWWLLPLLIISPLVFISFGLVTSKVGLSIGSGTIDGLLTVTTILVGLFVFKEWSSMSIYQYIGIGLIFIAIVLMWFSNNT